MKTQKQHPIHGFTRLPRLGARLCRTLAVGVTALAVSIAGAQSEDDCVVVDGHKAHPTHILAKFRSAEDMGGKAQMLNAAGSRVKHRYGLVRSLAILEDASPSVGRGQADADARRSRLLNRLEALKRTGLFEYVEPDYLVTTFAQPTDTAFVNGFLWGLLNTGQLGGRPGADVGATNAWDVTTGSTNVIVTVIDTGIRYTHQDLTNQMWRNPGEVPGNGLDDDGNGYVDDVHGINAITDTGNPFDDNDHGTHCSGTIGASANDAAPHVGVAWNVRLMGCKFLAASGGGFTANAIKCVDYAVSKGARILNNSWGGGGYSQGLYDSINAAREAGVLFVAAAGNGGYDNDVFPSYPSGYDLDNIIAVAAIDRNDNMATFSQYGAKTVDLGAPGVNIYSSTAGTDTEYQYFNGTSMATPHVVGVAALVLAKFPSADLNELRERLLLSVVPTPALAGRTSTGGRVNAYNALTITGTPILTIAVTPSSGSFLLTGSTEPVYVKLTDPFSVSTATVTGTLSTGGNLTFKNDGVAPDAHAGDAVYTASLSVPAVGTNFTLTITASEPNHITNERVVNYTAVPPPPNDHFTNATKVAVGGGLFQANNRFGTRETGEPNHAGVTTAAGSLWWAWTPTTATGVFLDTSGSSVDTVLAVYTGNALGSLTTVIATNDIGPKRQPFVSFNASAGVTYRIAVASANTNSLGGLQLRVTPNGAPDMTPPSVFVTAPLNGTVVTTNLVLVSGTADDPSPNVTGVSLVQVSVNGAFPVGASGTTNWSSLILLQPGLNTIQAQAFDAAGNLSSPAAIQVTYFVSGPDNDFFVHAFSLNDTNPVLVADTTHATKEAGEPNHAGSLGGKSAWWNYEAPADGLLTLSTIGSTFDTLLALYTGTNVAGLDPLASNDDAPDGTYSLLSQAVRSNQMYRIAVDGFDGLSGVVHLTSTFTTGAVYRLTVNTAGSGSVNPGSSDVFSNATVELTATPTASSQFDLWTGDVLSLANPLSVTVREDMTVTANFLNATYTDGFESGNLSHLPWVGGGNVPWMVRTNVVSQGAFAARSGVITHNQTSALLLTASFRAGTGSFDYKVSSEPSFDRLRFYVDGALLQTWSGEIGWASYSFPISAGTHTLEWRYSKDGANTLGADAGYLDNVNLPLVVGTSPASAARLQMEQQTDGNFFINLTGQFNQTYILQRSLDLTNWVNLSTNVATSGFLRIADPTPPTDQMRFYRAVATEQ